jgi:ribonucleoside-diphosphate reductase alpha chain
MKSPDGALTIEDMSALDQLEHWKRVKVNFTEHNPSCSVYVKDSEWVAVADWVYKNWDIVGGLSFFPVDSHVYPLAPLEKIDKKEYERRVREMPVIDFENLKNYEAIDNTKPSLACEGQSCIIE